MANYYAYLRSPEWERKRDEVLARAGYRCEQCGAVSVYLQVHHLTYANLYHEPLNDLLCLCETCHKERHACKTDQKRVKRLIGELR